LFSFVIYFLKLAVSKNSELNRLSLSRVFWKVNIDYSSAPAFYAVFVCRMISLCWYGIDYLRFLSFFITRLFAMWTRYSNREARHRIGRCAIRCINFI